MAEKEVGSNGIRGEVRRLYLAAIGGFTTVEEEAGKLVERLVEKGQEAEQEGKKLIRGRIEERRKEARKQAEGLEQQIDRRIEAVLERMNLPSKGDVRDLNKQIAQLAKKVDELKQATATEKKAA